MLGRRFLLLVAVLMGLTALAASIAPRESLIRERGRSSATPTPTPTPTVAAGTPVQTVDKTVKIGLEPVTVTVKEGALVHLTVTGSETDSVMLLSEIEPITGQSPAIFDLLADDPGSYPIELLDAERPVGTLVVRPAT